MPMRHGGREPACDTPTAGMSHYFVEGNSATFDGWNSGRRILGPTLQTILSCRGVSMILMLMQVYTLTLANEVSHYPKTRLYVYIYIYIYHSLSMQGGRTDSWCRISWTTWDMNMKSWVMQKFCPSTAKSVNRFKKRYEKLHSDHKDG